MSKELTEKYHARLANGEKQKCFNCRYRDYICSTSGIHHRCEHKEWRCPTLPNWVCDLYERERIKND